MLARQAPAPPLNNIAEPQLPSLIREYLDYNAYTDTLPIFESEHRQKGLAFQLLPNEGRVSKPEVLTELNTRWTNGERDAFFELYEHYVPEIVRASEEALRLEFYENIYFAVHHMHPATQSPTKGRDKAASMEAFKRFLETRGAQLSKTPEFLPFYALPYLPDPASHPSFSEIFTATTPRITELVRAYGEASPEQQQLQQQFQSLQVHYHSLLSVSSELVGTLAATLNGDSITPEYLSSVIQRLQALRQAHSVHKAEAHMPKQSVGVGQKQPQFLNYDKIKQDLSGGSNLGSARSKQLLLHALRWRLLQQDPAGRRRLLTSYVDMDIFNLRAGMPILNTLLSGIAEPVCEQAVKLLNVMASHFVGREYLLSSISALNLLIALFVREPANIVIRQHALGAIQKLSLRNHPIVAIDGRTDRRKAQTIMNQAHLVPFLRTMLSDSDGLSDYMVEYATALMMNLCLRTLGKRDCVQYPRETLKVLTELLEHESMHVKTYVNGILFSILSEPTIRNEARAMGLTDLLKYLRDVSGEPLTRQIDFVVQQLLSDVTPDVSDTSSEDGAEDDGEDEHEGEEDVFDVNELVQEVDPLADNELAAGNLLQKQYSAASASAQGRKVPRLPEYAQAPQQQQQQQQSVQAPKAIPATAIDMITRPQTPSMRATTPVHFQRPGSQLKMHTNSNSPMATGPSRSVSRSTSRAGMAAGETPAKRSLPAPAYKPPPPPPPANAGGAPVTGQELREQAVAFGTRNRLARTPIAE
ncbi:hypothetical protein RI367_005620 [Sorochytrium milnesiophthora]